MSQSRLPPPARHINVRPDQVFQREARGPAGVSFDRYVGEVLAISAAAVGLVVLGAVLALWVG